MQCKKVRGKVSGIGITAHLRKVCVRAKSNGQFVYYGVLKYEGVDQIAEMTDDFETPKSLALYHPEYTDAACMQYKNEIESLLFLLSRVYDAFDEIVGDDAGVQLDYYITEAIESGDHAIQCDMLCNMVNKMPDRDLHVVAKTLFGILERVRAATNEHAELSQAGHTAKQEK